MKVTLKLRRTETPATRLIRGLRNRARARALVVGYNPRQEYARAMAGPRNSAKEAIKYLNAVGRSPRVRAALRDALTVSKAQALP